VAWGEDRQSWSVAQGVIPGDTAKDETWNKADEILGQTFPDAAGALHPIRVLAVDSGFNTQNVYGWARRHVGRVIACKGSSTSKTLLGAPTNVDVKHNGKRYARGCKVWPVGVDQAKAELYGWLRLDPPTKESGAPYPPGYCHFPEHGEDFFKQLTAEHLVKTVTRKGFVHLEWQVIPNRENHVLDCRVYARAATVLCRLDQISAAHRMRAAAALPAPSPAAQHAERQPDAEAQVARSGPTESPTREPPRPGGWLGGRGGGMGKGGGWLGRRR
jgi:phage terminase large subunit GpA-like protein